MASREPLSTSETGVSGHRAALSPGRPPAVTYLEMPRAAGAPARGVQGHTAVSLEY